MHADRDLAQSVVTMHLNITPPRLQLTPKPNCSYHCMIAMALQASPVRKLPVNEIYKYILNNFPYFRTAADNWKNSVRHCLSLGHCFHKVDIPGMFAHKKGFHWETASDKMDSLNQEISKYLTSTGQSPEWFGIHGANLLNSSNQDVPTRHSTPRQSSSIHSSSFTSSAPSSFCHQPSNSPTVALPMTGSVGTIGLELNQTDLQILHLLAQAPLSQSERSTCDLSFLTGTDIDQDLNTIESYIKAGGSLTNLLDQTSTQSIPSLVSKSVELLKNETSNAYKNTAVRSHIGSELQLKQQQGLTGNSMQDGQTSHSLSLAGGDNTTNKFPALSILPGSLSTPVRVNTALAYYWQGITQTNKDIDYCDRSLPEFTVKYPGEIGRIEEETLAVELDAAYPFLCSDDEDLDMTLNKLMEDSDSDTSDEEEPIPRIKKRTKAWRNPLNLPFEPVMDDWNSWKESEYEEKMKKVVTTVIPKSPSANSSHVQSKSTVDSSKCFIGPRGGFLSGNDGQHCKHAREVHHNYKRRYVKKKAPPSQTEEQYSNTSSRTSQADLVSKQSITGLTFPESCEEESSITMTVQTKVIQTEKTLTNEPCCENKLSVNLADETSNVIVSIPFVKLLTSRQIKKYCSRLNK